MSQPAPNRGFTARPADPESWIRTPDPSCAVPQATSPFTARLTLDITPALRKRLKLNALQRGQSVADMLRALLLAEFPPVPDGDME